MDYNYAINDMWADPGQEQMFNDLADSYHVGYGSVAGRIGFVHTVSLQHGCDIVLLGPLRKGILTE